MDLDQVLREEFEALRDRVEVVAPILARPRRSWFLRVISFLSVTVV